jgi:hypothetical protein
MSITVMTIEDFQNLKKEFLDEIRSTMKEGSSATPRKLLKSKDVMDLLKVSKGTLRTLHLNGTLPHVKIGGAIYYDPEDINKMIEKHKRNVR